jgi:predicted ATPase
MSDAERTTEEASEQSWDLAFSAVELKESSALGADVRLDLSPHTTVLVGRNGAGKSLLLEKMHAGIEGAVGVLQTAEPDPAHFACEVDVGPSHLAGKNFKLRYECHWRPRDEEMAGARTAAPLLPTEVDLKVEEHCWIPEANQLLWRVDDGDITYNTGEHGEMPTGRTLVNWTLSRHGRGGFLFPAMVHPLRDLFFNVIRVAAGIPRSDGEREEIALPYPQPSRNRNLVEPRRIRWMAYRLVDWHEQDHERFEEFVEIGRRIGLLNEVQVKRYRDPEPKRTERSRDFASVLFDGTDFGLLSDGTLRVAEILLWLIFPGVKLLLIEEPETAVHPGLLSKLLAEIDAYSSDRQIVLSTQSPHVVSWADPRAIRLVERHAGKTEVRSLREDEVSRVSSYLHNEGTLGEFVYSGALDG